MNLKELLIEYQEVKEKLGVATSKEYEDLNKRKDEIFGLIKITDE